MSSKIMSVMVYWLAGMGFMGLARAEFDAALSSYSSVSLNYNRSKKVEFPVSPGCWIRLNISDKNVHPDAQIIFFCKHIVPPIRYLQYLKPNVLHS